MKQCHSNYVPDYVVWAIYEKECEKGRMQSGSEKVRGSVEDMDMQTGRMAHCNETCRACEFSFLYQ
jgi:hypothetical protein